MSSMSLKSSTKRDQSLKPYRMFGTLQRLYQKRSQLLEIYTERSTTSSLFSTKQAFRTLQTRLSSTVNQHLNVPLLLVITAFFLGDYVDRGFFSLEIMLILLMALIANPNAVFLNRGNQ